MLDKVILKIFWTSRLDHIRASRGSPMPLKSYLKSQLSALKFRIQGDSHIGAQRNIKPELRVGSSFRVIPEQFFSGVENVTEFFENIDNNLTYYEIPKQLACAYLKGHLKGRALDWFDVLGYKVVEEKATDYVQLIHTLTEPRLGIGRSSRRVSMRRTKIKTRDLQILCLNY
ncbi:uncharacterized protein TNCV_3348221 [Trichonephila clavipes]|nr:uncharacterized protein TNCV_3348221 [Trichonephila clavipes]